MTEELRSHPDLLRRFVPTPYVFSKCDGPDRVIVESNDLEIALGLRRAGVLLLHCSEPGGLLCKVIRDMTGPLDSLETTMVSDGPVRVLCRGRGTILIHDKEKSELLGFIARDVRIEELISSLIPTLLDTYKQQ
jgi:hypothetical protein